MGDRHRCFACSDHADRIVHRADEENWTLRYRPRFQGPVDHVNGGVSMGVLACLGAQMAQRLGHPEPAVRRVAGRLHRKVPQARDLQVTPVVDDDGGGAALEVTDGVDVLVSGQVRWSEPAEPLLDPAAAAELAALSEPSAEHLEYARTHPARSPERDVLFTRCFVCGRDNPGGLRLDSQLVGPGASWAPWTPAAEYADPAAVLSPAIAAAALDCPSASAIRAAGELGADETSLLGSFEVELLRPAPADVPGGYRVTSRFRGRQGRKMHADVGLFDRAGTAYALAKALWISVPAEAERRP